MLYTVPDLVYMFLLYINFLKPNDPYMGRTEPLTSRPCILYIYSTNIRLLLLQSELQPLVGFRPAQLSRILSRKVLQSAVASGTLNPQLGGEPVI
jgi:hypothetical protein